jgi:hypothetical protein
MNNLLSYCGLVDAKIGASGKDLPYRFRILIQRDGVRTNFSEDLVVNVIFLENDSIDCRLNVNLGKYMLNLKIVKPRILGPTFLV